ncbi:MAG: Hsp20/alpha crystallin family protein [Verrucomicrobiota bacterium]
MTLLTSWDPFKEFEVLQNRLGGCYGTSCDTSKSEDGASYTANWSPTVDITEDENEYLIEAELPRVDKDQVNLRVADGVLSISGERQFKREEKDKKKKVHRVERSYGSFVRSFRVPEDVDQEKVNAEFKDGVLAVHLPKSEVRKPKDIDIKIN